jgi:DNA-binding transcriptional LysR family regulator
MQFRDLDLNLLVALDMLLSEQNVTRAAERLHVSQPAMSGALQKLRAHLDDPLLQRFGNQLAPTPRAISLMGPVKDFLRGVNNLLQDEISFDPLIAERTFRIAMTGYCAEVYGVPLARAMARAAPNMVCQIQDLRADALVRLYHDQLDFCVMLADRAFFDPTYLPDNSCERLLFSDEFVLAGDKNNPLFEKAVSYDLFCKQPYVEVRLTDTLASVVEQALRRNPSRPKHSISVPTFLTAMLILQGSDHVAIVPRRLMERHGPDFGLVSVAVPLNITTLHETAIWHPRGETDPAHRWLQQLMIEVALELPSN